jgi:hypothetical protein
MRGKREAFLTYDGRKPMTYALCFSCGHTKFGALVPCRECGEAASGNPDLDIAFSDHVIVKATIDAFGAVVKAIRSKCDDENLCFWTFLRYVTVCHPDILKVTQPVAEQLECDQILSRASPPDVTVVRTEASRKFRKQLAANAK